MVVEQGLVQPLAGAKSGVHDRHLLLLETGQADEIAGQVDDPDRLAHIEDEDDSAVRGRPCLKNQAHRFGDGHEVAGGVSVGDGDGLALLELPLEHRDHAAAGAQDIAKSDGHEWTARPPGAGDGQ